MRDLTDTERLRLAQAFAFPGEREVTARHPLAALTGAVGGGRTWRIVVGDRTLAEGDTIEAAWLAAHHTLTEET